MMQREIYLAQPPNEDGASRDRRSQKVLGTACVAKSSVLNRPSIPGHVLL